MRTPYVTIAVLLAILVPIGFATDDGASEAGTDTAPIATIATRVEALRGLDFRTTPEPATVTPEEATRDGLADLDRSYPPAARRADEALYTALGLLPGGTDLREVSSSIFGEQVAGYYDPRSKRLRIVEGVASNRVLDEMILAHELTHALEDQQIGLDLEAAEASDDAGYAYQALVEGTATELMYGYVSRHFDAEVGLGGILSGSLAAPTGSNLPPFILAGLLFPYEQGQKFVAELYRRGGRTWKLVDLAERTRPPASTEQIMHPQKWIESEPPLAVTVPAAPDDFTRVTDGVFGEWQTGQLLALAGRAQPDAAAGWGGDRYVLYRRGDRQALIIRWRWDTAGDGDEFVTALRAYEKDGLESRPAGIAITERDGAVTLVLATDQILAEQLSRA